MMHTCAESAIIFPRSSLRQALSADGTRYRFSNLGSVQLGSKVKSIKLTLSSRYIFALCS